MSKKNISKKTQTQNTTNKSVYEWFRNNSSSSNDKNSRSFGWKQIWRFAKIFIYLFLFACTATGCVQIFAIGGESRVGKGVELYNSENQVSPHITKFNLSKKTVNNKDIYELEPSAENIFIRDQKELNLLHKEINENQNLKMSSAYNGVNESFIITGQAFKTPLQENKIATYNSRPAILSSAFLNAKEEEQEEKLKESNYLFKDLNIESVKLSNNKSFFEELNNLEALSEGDTSKQKRKIISSELSLSDNLRDQVREQFSLGFMKLTLEKELDNNQTLSDWIISSLKEGNDDEKIAASKTLSTIFAYSGIQWDGKNKIHFTEDFMQVIGTSESTNYRPIASWGQAWTHLGPFYGMFVYPISYLSTSILKSFGFLNGWETIFAMIIIVVMIRLLTFLLGFKSVLQQTKMQELSAKRASIEAKYAPYKGNKQMENRQRQEISQLYKKEGISPAGQFLNILITTPFFLSVWRVTQATPQIKSTVWLGIDFSATSYQRLFSGEAQYLPIILFAAIFSLGQQLVPRLLANRRNRSQINVHQKAAMRRNNRIQNIMMIAFVVMALIFNAGIQVYWIISGSWMICQGIFTHYLFIKQKERSKRKKLGL